MNKLFSVLFVMTVVCYGANNPVSEALEETPLNQIGSLITSEVALIKKGSCVINLDATNAADEDKEAAYHLIEEMLTKVGIDIPETIDITVGIANLELVNPAAYDLSAENQETDHVIAVKDIKALGVLIDIECPDATAEEKSLFFGAVSAALASLCHQLQSVASGITGSVTFNSPDLTAQEGQQKGLLDGVVGTITGQVAPLVNELPIGLPAVPAIPSVPGVPAVPGLPSLPGLELPVIPGAPVLDSVLHEVLDSVPAIPVVGNVIL